MGVKGDGVGVEGLPGTMNLPLPQRYYGMTDLQIESTLGTIGSAW